jgi:hypothetical protein
MKLKLSEVKRPAESHAGIMWLTLGFILVILIPNLLYFSVHNKLKAQRMSMDCLE